MGPPEGSARGPTRWQRSLGQVLWFLSIGRNALCIFIASVISKVLDEYTDGEVPFAIVGESQRARWGGVGMEQQQD